MSAEQVVAQLAAKAVDPNLSAQPLDVPAALESGVLRFAAQLTAPDGAPIGGATVLFMISVAARMTVKCAAVTGGDGIARAESMLPVGLLDRGPLEFRIGFAGAPPMYWPISIAGRLV